MVNGSHSAIAYLGVMAGWDTVDRAICQPASRRFAEALMREEIEPTLAGRVETDLAAYRARLIERFANPALAHRTKQIAMDGSQKIPQRWLGTVRDRLAAGASIERLALAVAAWLHFLRGVDEAGQRYTIDDPLAGELAVLGDRAEALCGFTPVFGELGGEPRFVAPVAVHLAQLRTHGVQATLEALP
jgi:fructuronate reductase